MGVEFIAVGNQQATAAAGGMDRAPLDAHVVQLQAAQATEGGIMIAGNVDDLAATARQTRYAVAAKRGSRAAAMLGEGPDSADALTRQARQSS